MIVIKDNLLEQKVCNDLITTFENNISKAHTHHTTIFLNLHEVDFRFSQKLNFFYTHFLNSKGLNVFPECTQIVKWPQGANQGPHLDQAREFTVYTSITYLNDNFNGGHTYFENDFSVKPITGRGFFFKGDEYKHGVSKVTEGTRYTLAIWYTNNLNNIL